LTRWLPLTRAIALELLEPVAATRRGTPAELRNGIGHWLLRALGVGAGIYGPDTAEATYPITRVDAGETRSTPASTGTH